MSDALVPFPTRTERAIAISQKYARLALHLEHDVELWTRQFNCSGSPTRRRELGAVIRELVGALAAAGSEALSVRVSAAGAVTFRAGQRRAFSFYA